MKIALIGYGKMGKEIHKIASKQNIEVIIIDPKSPFADFKNINQESLKDIDVAIDYSTPDSVIKNIELISKHKVNLVVGTTGWYDKIDLVKELTKDIGFIYSSNFSIGVNIFFEIIKESSKIINKFTNYDIAGLEIHHNEKQDSPSGTASTIADILIKNIERKKTSNYNKINQKIDQTDLHFASLRNGLVPGVHKVYFDSQEDSITLEHSARSRAGFAEGSVKSAIWIKDKKGFFDINDLINSIINDK